MKLAPVKRFVRFPYVLSRTECFLLEGASCTGTFIRTEANKIMTTTATN